MKKILTLLVLVILACPVRAALISYSFSGIAAGSVGGVQFPESAFILWVTAETDDIVTGPDGRSSAGARSSRISIAGVGEGEFLNSSLVTLDLGELYFSIPSSESSFYVSSDEVLGISLSAPQAPLFFPLRMDSDFQPTPTSMGELSLFPVRDVTFSASLVPEPAVSGCLAGAAFLCLLSRRRVL